MNPGVPNLRVLVVDDESAVSQSARRVFVPAAIETTFAGCLSDLPRALKANGRTDVVIVTLPRWQSTQDVVACVNQTGYSGPLIILADAAADVEPGPVKGLPAARCVIRPRSAVGLDRALKSVVPGTRGMEPNSLPINVPYHGMVGQSPQIRQIFATIEKVALGDVNVCICGESGTGKELIARAIHYASPRRDRPLVTFDCTTVPEGLMESQLLGHVKGAFTGAVEHREGVFSLAHGGTLFMDELGELGLKLQAKLLRVIQTHEFIMVGGMKPIRTDVRVITATNKDLKEEVEKGNFREDLYYRVAVVMIKVPPLRERTEDIPLLTEHFLKKFSARYGKAISGVEPSAMKRMLGLPWPGNVRQLANLLEQGVVLAEGDVLTRHDLFRDSGAEPAATSTMTNYEPGLPLREVERRHILQTLAKAGGNKAQTARLLGISLRCLQYKVKGYTLGADITRAS